MTIEVASMMTAVTIIVIILLSGASRIYIRHKFDVTAHIKEVERAAKRHEQVTSHTH